MYKMKTVRAFDAAHFLADYQGKCRNIHGHRWSVEITVGGGALHPCGEKRGMLFDFGDLKADLEEEVGTFDHALIYEKGTLKASTVAALEAEKFRLVAVDFRPTAENFARCFCEKMQDRGYPVLCSTVYETPDNCASYEPDREDLPEMPDYYEIRENGSRKCV